MTAQALKGRNNEQLRTPRPVAPFQGLRGRLPRAALGGFAAALCPGLVCSGPFGAMTAVIMKHAGFPAELQPKVVLSN